MWTSLGVGSFLSTTPKDVVLHGRTLTAVSPLVQVFLNIEMIKSNHMVESRVRALHSYMSKNVDAGRVKNWGYCVYHSLLKTTEMYVLLTEWWQCYPCWLSLKHHLVDRKRKHLHNLEVVHSEYHLYNYHQLWHSEWLLSEYVLFLTKAWCITDVQNNNNITALCQELY